MGRLVAHVATSNAGSFPIPAYQSRGFVDGSELSFFSVPSYIRGYHAYQGVWSPFTGEVLPLEREPEKLEDNIFQIVWFFQR